MSIDLDELEKLNAERTQGHWRPGIDETWTLHATGDVSELIGHLHTRWKRHVVNARAICAAMNALPTLLRIARAAERYREACEHNAAMILPARGELFAAVGALKGGT